MSRWSNPFVSLGVVLLLTACHSTPREESDAPKLYIAKSTSDGTVKANAAVPNAPAAAVPVTAVPAPVAPVTAATTPAAPAATTAVTPPATGVTVPAKAVAPPVPEAPVPERATQQYASALKLMKSGQVTDAELEFKQLTAAYPTLTGPQLNLGLLYLQASRLPEAEAAFKGALDTNPANAVAGNELGIVERKLGKFSDAEAAYQRTIAAEPNYAPAYLNLGVLYDLYLAEPQKALEQFEHYLELAGQNKQVAGWVVELRKRVGAPAPAKKDPAA